MSASAPAQVQIALHLQALIQLRLKMLQKSKQKPIVFQPKTHGPTMELLLYIQAIANLNNNYLNPKLL